MIMDSLFNIQQRMVMTLFETLTGGKSLIRFRIHSKVDLSESIQKKGLKNTWITGKFIQSTDFSSEEQCMNALLTQ